MSLRVTQDAGNLANSELSGPGDLGLIVDGAIDFKLDESGEAPTDVG